jgi:uncharacterized protein YecE (DUF72 family)
MQFGRTDPGLLNDIDFKLPAEPAFNQGVLPGRLALKPSFYLGATSWNRKDWVGSVFPKGTKEKDFLEQYAKHYNCVELNATHYKIYPPETIRKWAEKVKGRDFRFCPKVPQSISHYSNLVNAKEPTTAFLEGVMAFEEHLGPIFLQVGEQFSPARKDQLYNYLASLPTDLTFFLELRHPEWFIQPQELYTTLRQLGIGLVITDAAGRRDCAHMHLPLPKAFIRYVGNGLHPTDYIRADDWVNRLHYWLENGLEEIYFFLHMHDDVAVPEMSIYLASKLEAASGLKLTKPVIHRDNTLF